MTQTEDAHALVSAASDLIRDDDAVNGRAVAAGRGAARATGT